MTIPSVWVAALCATVSGQTPIPQTGSSDARITAVFLAQTHVMKPDQPYFKLVGHRPALLKAQVVSPSGAPAPEVVGIIQVAGETHTLPLRGPATLPRSLATEPGVVQHRFEDSFTALIPARLVRPGMAVEVRAGASGVRHEIKVGAPTVVPMKMFDVHYFGKGTNDYPAGFFQELEAKWPVAQLEIERVRGINFPELVIPARGSASSVAGVASDRPGLVDLLHRLAAMPGEFRVRLSSLEATEAGDDLLDLLRQWPNRFCPHLHLALQSGSNRILRAMRRPWPVERVLERCRAAKQALGDPALTTDIIVGFPGESEDDFAATCEAVVAAGFSKLHVFRFSPRAGTEAASLPNAVDPHVKHERATQLEAIGLRLRQEFCRQQVGRTVEVLVEGVDPASPGRVLGTSERYLDVSLDGDNADVGKLRKTAVVGVVGEMLKDREEPFPAILA